MLVARRRDLGRAKRLESGLAGLRWFLVAFGVFEAAAIQGGEGAPGHAVPLSAGLVVALFAGNVAVSWFAERTKSVERLARVGVAAFAMDIVVVTGLVWASAGATDDPVWLLGYLLPIEGAIRYELGGALAPVALALVSDPLRTLYLARRSETGFSFHAVLLRLGVELAVAVVAGWLAASLRRAHEASERAGLAEAAARREAAQRREAVAAHAATLAGLRADDIDEGLQTMAESIAHDLALGPFSILLARIPLLVAKGVHGDPGYQRGTEVLMGEGPIGRAATERHVLVEKDAPGIWSVAVPLTHRDELVGVLHERLDGGDPIDPERVKQLERLAGQIAVAVRALGLRAAQDDALQRLRELDAMKADFVGITSHELRTPLAAVRGFVNTLTRRLDELSHEEIREFLDIIEQQSDRLVRLVEDLLLVSRIEAEKITLNREPVCATEFLEETVRGLGDGRARVETELHPGLPERIEVDPRRVAQVLTNLLQNALKFSPSAETVLLRAAPADGGIRFAVTDRGVGIPQEELGKIFERFHRTDTATTRKAEGAGLGLYITKRLVEAMGGEIGVESEVGRGSTFTFLLPGEPRPEAPAPRSEEGRAG